MQIASDTSVVAPPSGAYTFQIDRLWRKGDPLSQRVYLARLSQVIDLGVRFGQSLGSQAAKIDLIYVGPHQYVFD